MTPPTGARIVFREIDVKAPTRPAALLALTVAIAACAPAAQPPTETTLVSATAASPATTPPPPPLTTTSTQATATTTVTEPQTYTYAVVAEEASRRIAVIDLATPCQEDDGGTCLLTPVLSIDLPHRPHNLAAVGAVVYATHTTAGAVSRVDLATGEVLTVAIGVEPHDIEYDAATDILYLTDEEGRSLLTLDPLTLGVLNQVSLPGRAHNLALLGSAVWVTLVGDDRLARVTGDGVEFFPTGGTPHDLIGDNQGEIWFSNWNSSSLDILHPDDGETAEAPPGASQPHHLALGPDGTIWVSDNGGAAVVQFSGTGVTTVEVGPVPHHIAFIGETLIVAVSGAGEAVLVRGGEVVGRVVLSEGLHGVAVVETGVPLGG